MESGLGISTEPRVCESPAEGGIVGCGGEGGGGIREVEESNGTALGSISIPSSANGLKSPPSIVHSRYKITQINNAHNPSYILSKAHLMLFDDPVDIIDNQTLVSTFNEQRVRANHFQDLL